MLEAQLVEDLVDKIAASPNNLSTFNALKRAFNACLSEAPGPSPPAPADDDAKELLKLCSMYPTEEDVRVDIVVVALRLIECVSHVPRPCRAILQTPPAPKTSDRRRKRSFSPHVRKNSARRALQNSSGQEEGGKEDPKPIAKNNDGSSQKKSSRMKKSTNDEADKADRDEETAVGKQDEETAAVKVEEEETAAVKEQDTHRKRGRPRKEDAKKMSIVEKDTRPHRPRKASIVPKKEEEHPQRPRTPSLVDPKKRGRGRPRKRSKSAEQRRQSPGNVAEDSSKRKDELADARVVHSIQLEEGKKRGRGRPRKAGNEKVDEKPVAMKTRGRPRKRARSSSIRSGSQARRGRPAKHPKFTPTPEHIAAMQAGRLRRSLQRKNSPKPVAELTRSRGWPRRTITSLARVRRHPAPVKVLTFKKRRIVLTPARITAMQEGRRSRRKCPAHVCSREHILAMQARRRESARTKGRKPSLIPPKLRSEARVARKEEPLDGKPRNAVASPSAV